MTSAGDYVAMCKALLDNVRWFDASPVGSPAGSPFDTDQLAAAVDDSFARDPIFGTIAPDSALALSSRGRTLARTPASPRFPIALE
jgi:hypothetical protein